MEKRKQIEEILLNDYGCFDDFTVDKLLDLFSVVGRSEQLPCDECVDGQKWSPYYAKYVECDCRK